MVQVVYNRIRKNIRQNLILINLFCKKANPGLSLIHPEGYNGICSV